MKFVLIIQQQVIAHILGELSYIDRGKMISRWKMYDAFKKLWNFGWQIKLYHCSNKKQVE